MTEHKFPRHQKTATLFAIAIILLLVATSSKTFYSSAQKFSPANIIFAGNISGRVFQDFNGNGNFDTTTTIANNGFGTIGVAIDRGVAGVTVSVFDSAGVARGSTTTIADGTYSVAATGTGPYRVEFTNLPTGFLPSARNTNSTLGGTATNSGSTVQFLNDLNTANVNLAVNYPSDYSQNNPEVVASLYTAGDQITGSNNGTPVLSSFPYSAGSTDTTAGASEVLFETPVTNPLDVAANQIGTAHGLTYARSSRLLYVGAFFKRHAGFGPQGPNAIYVVNRTGTGSVTNFFIVPGTVTNSHNTADYNRDNNNIGWDAVGKTSLGGLAISEDEASLFVYNLGNRTLYKLNASNGLLVASQAVLPTLPLAVGNCAPGDVRPFALSVYRGQLYAGFVCSAESSATVDTFTDTNGNLQYDSGDYFIDANLNNVRDVGESYFDFNGNSVFDAGEAFVDNDGNRVYNLGNASQLRAYVYTVNQTTLAYGATPIFQTPLNYRRGLTTHTSGARGEWRPWSPIYRNASTGTFRPVYTQPMLTDIAFDNGNLILGLRDRIGDQVGNGTLSNPGDASNTNLYQPRTAGDIIRACGAIGSWTVENNGRCGSPVTGTAPQNVAEGLGGGEFYYGDAYDLTGDFIAPAVNVAGKGGNHDETGSGGVEQFPGAPHVMISNFDPIPNIVNMIHDGGIRWLSNTTGNFAKGYRLYNGNGNDTGVFGKAGGVGGNLTLLSDPAPIEIGNRVWRDSNANGVQDPNENPISGVTVRLYQGSTLVGTAVTDANGEFYFVFSAIADSNTADNIGQVNGGIFPNTAYQVRFDNPANYLIGNPLFGLVGTAANQTLQSGDDDSSDSDALNVINPSGSPAGTFPVISHMTGGVGSNNHTLDAGFRTAPSAANASIEGQIFSPNGNGIRNVRLILTEENGAVRTAITSSFGYYRFDDVQTGQTVILSVYSKRFTFSEPTRTLNVSDDLANIDFIADK